jgi:hypothetical protein
MSKNTMLKCPACNSNLRKYPFHYWAEIGYGDGGTEGRTSDNGKRCVNKDCRLQYGDGRITYRGKTFELWRIEFGSSFIEWIKDIDNNGK